ncbi:MAG: PH domain-containing protein [Minisyncoccia bacterium]
MFQIFFYSNKTFDGMLAGEKSIFLIRRHKLFFFLPILLFVFLAFLIFVFVSYLPQDIYQKFSDLILFLEIVCFSILWLGLFLNLMLYSLTTLILTNQRIIKIEEKGLFNYERSELELNKIQDISVNLSGLLGNFLNFGEILIQTAAAENKFKISFLPNPLMIKSKILEVKAKKNEIN